MNEVRVFSNSSIESMGVSYVLKHILENYYAVAYDTGNTL